MRARPSTNMVSHAHSAQSCHSFSCIPRVPLPSTLSRSRSTPDLSLAVSPPGLRLLDLPDELFENILLRACDAKDGYVPFTAWRLTAVCRRFRATLYSSVCRVDLSSCFEHESVNSREAFAGAAGAVLAGPLMRCTRLQQLDISGCDSLSDAQVIRFLRVAPPLRSFTAVICMRQTDALVTALAAASGPKLDEIDLSGCDRYRHGSLFRRPRPPRQSYRPCRALSDAALYQLATHCVGLRKIALCSAIGATDSGLAALATLPLLQTVILRRLTEITNTGIALLANGKGDLHTFHLLSIASVTDAGFIAVAKGSATRNLASVAITFNCNITDRAVRALLHSAPLEELRCDHCTLLSESWTRDLEGRFDKLRTVSLRGASLDTTAQGIRNLANVARLREINLGFVGSVNADMLQQLKRCAPALEALILEACSKVDDAAATALADFPHLATLDVSWCSRLTAAGIVTIVRGATGKRLKNFCLGPVNVSATRHRTTLYELGKTCTELMTLVLCGEVDHETLEWLRKNSPAEVEYADVIFRSSKRRSSSTPSVSGMSE